MLPVVCISLRTNSQTNKYAAYTSLCNQYVSLKSYGFVGNVDKGDRVRYV